jgi:uncharacterized protein (DUF1330 family)
MIGACIILVSDNKEEKYMSVYFIANIKVNDEQEYQKYLDGCDEVFQKYLGEYLAVDDQPMFMEGGWDYSRTVVIRFPSKEDFNNWYYSVEYQELLQHRLKGSLCDRSWCKEDRGVNADMPKDIGVRGDCLEP